MTADRRPQRSRKTPSGSQAGPPAGRAAAAPDAPPARTAAATAPARRKGGRGRRTGMTYDQVRQAALALPGVEDGMSYGTPALKVRGKLLIRLKEDGDSIVLLVDFDVRDILMRAEPATYYITDHYLGYPAVLVRLANLDPDAFATVLEESWRHVAPKRLAATRQAPADSDAD